MSLPPWVAEVAAKLTDPTSLVLVDATFGGEGAVVLAKISLVDEARRVEVQPVAVILDTELLGMIEIDPGGEGRMHSLVQTANPTTEVT